MASLLTARVEVHHVRETGPPDYNVCDARTFDPRRMPEAGDLVVLSCYVLVAMAVGAFTGLIKKE